MDDPSQKSPKSQFPKRKTRKDKFIANEDTIAQVGRMAEMGLNQKQISKILGITTDCFYDHKNENPKLLSAFVRGKALGEKAVVETCFKMATSEQNFEATKFFLKSKVGWRDSDPPFQMNFIRSVAGHTDLDRLSKDELAVLIEEAMRSRGYEVKPPKELEEGKIVDDPTG